MPETAHQKLLTKGHIALGTGLSVVVFIAFSIILRPYTFSPDPLISQVQASFAALPITTVFWLAYHMFMLVLVDQMKQKRGDK